MGLLKKIFGDYSSREIKRITPIKDKVLALDEEYSKLTDEELKAKPLISRSASPTARPLTISCPRRSPPAVRHRGACSE